MEFGPVSRGPEPRAGGGEFGTGRSLCFKEPRHQKDFMQ